LLVRAVIALLFESPVACGALVRCGRLDELENVSKAEAHGSVTEFDTREPPGEGHAPNRPRVHDQHLADFA